MIMISLANIDFHEDRFISFTFIDKEFRGWPVVSPIDIYEGHQELER